MQETNMVRNIAIIGHGNCGKTSLAEAMLFTAGKINRLGKVDEGHSAMDYEDEEIARNISINTGFHNYTWKKHSVFLMTITFLMKLSLPLMSAIVPCSQLAPC